MIPEERIKLLNNQEASAGDYVLYWMQASQRTQLNHAMTYAMEMANGLDKPLLVYFGLTDSYPEASERHYRFMLEGLQEVQRELESQGIQFILLRTSPPEGAELLSRNASLVVTDRGYLRIQRAWREELLSRIRCPLVQVESDVMVPVDETSLKEEYSAATIRRKIERLLPRYSVPLEEVRVRRPSLDLETGVTALSLKDLDGLLDQLDIRRDVPPVSHLFKGGHEEATRRLTVFIHEKLPHYGEGRNDPASDFASNLSPYLHFGQISPLEIYLSLYDHQSESKRVFLDELIIRRELAMNFTERNEDYDSYRSIASFARVTLEKHRDDERPYIYSFEELEEGRTHDIYWNAAQLEMVHTGKMQGYMRMYWGKKVLEWTSSPESAYETLVHLNDKYSLDGRDPNGYAGIAWCFGKHDRPWKERPVFGTVRYMNAKGLERKFKMKDYVEKVRLILLKE